MPTLKRIRENREKREKIVQHKAVNYTPPEPMYLITKIIKQQNLSLIDFICDKYDLYNKYDRKARGFERI